MTMIMMMTVIALPIKPIKVMVLMHDRRHSPSIANRLKFLLLKQHDGCDDCIEDRHTYIHNNIGCCRDR